MIKNKIGALASVALLALGLAACGSSSSSSSSIVQLEHIEQCLAGTISGAGSTFAAPVYEQWASSQSGLTVNYQAVGSGAGITALETKTVDFGASDPPLKPEDEEAIAKNGSPAVQIPMFLGAITVSYNLPGVEERAEAGRPRRSPTSTWARSRPGTTPRSRRSTPASRCRAPRSPSSTARTPRARLPASPASSPRPRPNSRARSAKARTCSGRRAQAPRATPASPAPCSRRPARSATSSRPTRCSTNSPTRRSRTRRASSSRRRSNRRAAAAQGVKVPANLGIKIINSPAPERLPDHLADVHHRQQGPLQGGHPRRRKRRQGRRQVHQYGLGEGQCDPVAGRLRGAAGGDPGEVQGSRRRACSATARRSAEQHDARRPRIG